MKLTVFSKILIIAGFTQLLFSGINNKGEAFEYFLQGEYELLQHNFKQAEINYARALSLAPDSPTILKSLAEIKSYQGHYADAIKYLEKIRKIDPHNKDAGLELYQLYLQEENPEKAEAVIDSLILNHQNDLDLLYAKAEVQFSRQHWEDLLLTYKTIYLLDNDKINILLKIYEIGTATGQLELVRGILWELKGQSNKIEIVELLVESASALGEIQEEIVLIQDIININGSSDKLLIRLGGLYLRNEQFEEVINTLYPLYEIQNYTLDVLRILLIAYSTLNLFKQEIEISRKLVEEYPELSVGYEALSFAYINSGENGRAVEILLGALSRFPQVVTFPFSLAAIYNNSSEYGQAEKYYLLALDIQPDMTQVKHALAILYEDMQNTNLADSLFSHMIEKDKNDVVGLNDYAYIISERNSSSQEELNYALNLVVRATDIEPNNPAFLDTIGWIYFKLGTYQKAKEYIEKSLNISNDNPVILEHLGDIYCKLDKVGEAIKIYEKVLEIDSANQNILNKINILNDR